MIINRANLNNLFVAFQSAFNQAFSEAQPMWDQVATAVPSTTSENHYAWLGQFPQLREWVGDRHLKGMASHDYRLKNKPFESTVEVQRDQIEDDQHGIYTPLFSEMGRAASTHPDSLVFPLLKEGFTAKAYDGQPFFDTDHPVGKGVASNTGGGSGTPWFLLDTSRAIKPIIFQRRRDYALRQMTTDTDEAVFMRGSYRYGVDARVNVGFGFWQMAYGSKQTLDKAAYGAARQAMMGFKSDEGRPLGITPRLLVVPPSLEQQGLEILNADRDSNGATNVYRNTAQLLVVPWLA